MERHPVLDREPGAHAACDEAVVLGASLRLGVVVDAVGVRQQPHAAHRAGISVKGAECFLEPAQGSGGRAAQHDTLAPSLAQDLVETVGAPSAEHAHDVATADVDDVLGEQVRGEVRLHASGALVASEERHVARFARGREAAIEAHHVVVGIARGGGQEADAGARGVGEREHVVVQQRPVPLHREAAAAESDDLWGLWSHS